MIKRGDKGEEVALCQKLLNEKGYVTSIDSDFGPSTEKSVKQFQEDNGLVVDGIVGDASWNALLESKISNSCSSEKKHIVHNGKRFPIGWDKVVLWDDPGGLAIKPGKYYDNSGKEERIPAMFVNHWDVCLSSKYCTNVLNNRGVSVHFCIDNDGTIYQVLDTQHGAWHCSRSTGNKKSIGVEISNAYYLKYQDTYVRNGFGRRPIQTEGRVHGRTLDPFLWFYPIQIDALKALWLATSNIHGIPLEYPKNSDGTPCTSTHKECVDGTFKGFCNHYNFTDKKIDCAGLNLPHLIEEVRVFIGNDD